MLVLGLPRLSAATRRNYCIATNGGFGNGGSSFIGKGFVLPAAGLCLPWSGFNKNS
jgi:hypothetical protein